jgi:hypothetical protein
MPAASRAANPSNAVVSIVNGGLNLPRTGEVNLPTSGEVKFPSFADRRRGAEPSHSAGPRRPVRRHCSAALFEGGAGGD